MKRILLMADEAAGNGNQPPAKPATEATPPIAAETVANGKSEREALLERQKKKLITVSRSLAESKKKVEIKNAYLEDENNRLKRIAATPAPTPKPISKESAWGFFKS